MDNNVNILDLSLSSEKGWFAFENNNMEQSLYVSKMTAIKNAFISQYSEEGAKNYIKLDKEDRTKVCVYHRNLLGVIKVLIEDPKVDIQLSLKNINSNESIIKKPYEEQRIIKQLRQLMISREESKDINSPKR